MERLWPWLCQMTEKGWEQFEISIGPAAQLYTISVSFSFVRVARLSKVKVKKTKRIRNGRRPRRTRNPPKKSKYKKNGRLRLVVPPLLYYIP